MRVPAELEGQVVPDERIWRAADIDRVTLARYMALLVRAHIVQPVSTWRTNRLKRLTSRSKQFFADTALALAIAGISGDDLEASPDLAGRYVESYVTCQLRPEVDRLRGSIHHVRDTAGAHEVDLLIDIGGGLIGIETTASVQPRAADAKHLM